MEYSSLLLIFAQSSMSSTARISNFLRKIGLLRFAENIRFRWQQWKYKKGNDAFRKAHPAVVFPPDFFIYETYRLNLGDYYHDGQATAKEILQTVGKAIDLHRPGIAVLDWGCGPGRITRHFPQLLPSATIYGTDYNEQYINWCSRHLPGIHFSKNTIAPPLSFNDSSFDLIIGISIFTHLSPQNHVAWIAELYRVSKPGAVILITTQGAAYRDKMLATERERFDSGELVIRENIKEGNRLFSAFQPPAFMKQLITGKFEVIDFIAAPIGENEPGQDEWVMKKV